MKKVRSFIREYWWPLGIALGVMAPGIAFAAKEQLVSMAQGACEAQAKASFKKKAVEIEMALIAGSLNELELSSARESLQERLRRESAKCASRFATASRSSAEEASSGSL